MAETKAATTAATLAQVEEAKEHSSQEAYALLLEYLKRATNLSA